MNTGARLLTVLALTFSSRVCVCQDSVVTNRFGIQFVRVDPGRMIVGRFEPGVGKRPEHMTPSMYAKALDMANKARMPGFTVTIKRSFYLGKFEVTQQQWEKIIGGNPSVFKNDSSGNRPVENVTWNDAQAFVKKLNELDKAHYYRLPTEFEWEYAARAGAEDDISWDEIRRMAVLSGGAPDVVGSKMPNAWGFYDMLGNVWEWVQDIYNEKLFADPSPPRLGKQHVLKGASFTGDVKNATYMTHAAGPGNGFDVGLRIVMEIK